MNLIEGICFWCETRITKSSLKLFWICDYESAECDFHPVAWDSVTLKPTGNTGPHQTDAEVQAIIRQDWVDKVISENKKLSFMRSVDDNVVFLSKKPQRTSRKAANSVLPNSGTIRRHVFDLIKSSGNRGMTDHELEIELRGKHQTISASRRSLVIDKHVVDSGNTRRNPQGNDCIVWVASDEVFSEVLFHV